MKNYLADVIDEKDGVFDIDLVSKAANRAVFQNPCKNGLCSLGKNNEVVGLVLRPGQVIPRSPKNGEPYTFQFSEDSIKRARESWVKKQAQLNAGLEHSEEKLHGMTFTENWIVEDSEKDKANLYGFKPIRGEWYVKLLIENEEALEALRNGEVTGLSLEGDFTLTEITEETELSEIKETTAERHNFNHMNFIDKIKALLAEEEKPAEEVKAQSEEVKAEAEEEKKDEEVKAAMSPEEMEAAIMDLLKWKEEMTAPAEEEPAAEEMSETENLKEAITALSDQLQGVKTQLSEMPVADTIKREKTELKQEERVLSIQEILNQKNS